VQVIIVAYQLKVQDRCKSSGNFLISLEWSPVIPQILPFYLAGLTWYISTIYIDIYPIYIQYFRLRKYRTYIVENN